MTRRLSNILTPNHEQAVKKENRKFGQACSNLKARSSFGLEQSQNCPKLFSKKRESLCVTPTKIQRFSKLPSYKKILNSEAKMVTSFFFLFF
jgi:hypothetical protein